MNFDRSHPILSSTGLADTFEWARDTLSRDSASAPKAIFAGVFVIVQALVDGASSVVFWGVWAFWALDMLGGTARAMHQGDRWRTSKALAGILKFGVVMGAWVAAVVAEEMALESWGVSLEVGWVILGAGAGIFLGSFAGQVGYFHPPLGKVLEGLAKKLFAGNKGGGE